MFPVPVMAPTLSRSLLDPDSALETPPPYLI